MNAEHQRAGDTGIAGQIPSRTAPERKEFWADTCREMTQMHIASKEVMDLYRKHGCRFCEPTLGQVDEVLKALDSAMPFWDRVHPELFYQTLELNFPELVRHA